MSVTFSTSRENFSANIKDLSLSQILLYFVADEELPEALKAELRLNQNGESPGGEAAPIEGVIGTRRGNGSSWLPILGKVPEGKWQLTLPNSSAIRNLLKKKQ